MKNEIKTILVIIFSGVAFGMLIFLFTNDLYEAVTWGLVGVGLSLLYQYEKSALRVKWLKWKEKLERENKKLIIILIIVALIVFSSIVYIYI